MQLLIDPKKQQALTQLISECEQKQQPDQSDASEGGKEPSSENPSKTDTLERVTSKEVKAIYHLFKKPHWGRCWVIQEFCLARQATFVCGDKVVDEDTLVGASMLALSIADDADRAYQVLAADGLVTLFKARSDFQEQMPDFDMVKMLWDFKAWLATDPRDKVYALLGLVSEHDRTRLGIVPDYTLGVAECFRRASTALLIHRQNLDSLVTETSTRTLPASPTGTPQGQSAAQPLPSWACNWGCSETKVYQLPLGSTRSRDEKDKPAEFKPFAASGDCSSYDARMKDADTLVLSGFTVDKLKHVGEALLVPDVMYGSVTSAIPEKGLFRSFKDVVVGFGDYFDTIIDWIALALDSGAAYPTGEDRERVLCETLIASHIPDGADKTFEFFKHWRRILSLPKSAKVRAKRVGLHRLHGVYASSIALAGILSAATSDVTAGDQIFSSLMQTSISRRLGVTEKGYLALVSGMARPGDSVVLCKGGKLPFVMREVDQRGQW
ncbi:hypothetical protein ACJ41O_010261 [Fusarium nematophilum]